MEGGELEGGEREDRKKESEGGGRMMIHNKATIWRKNLAGIFDELAVSERWRS